MICIGGFTIGVRYLECRLSDMFIHILCITHTGAGPNFFSPPKSCHALFLLLSTERTAVHSLVLNLWLSSANHRGDRAGADPAKPPDFEQWRHALYLLFRVPSSMDRIEVALWLVRINTPKNFLSLCFSLMDKDLLRLKTWMRQVFSQESYPT